MTSGASSTTVAEAALEPAQGRAAWGGGLRGAGPRLALASGALMLLACNVNRLIGHGAIAFKHYYAHTFVLACVIAAACRLRRLAPGVWADMAREALRALPWFLTFCGLIGVSALASNGTIYEAMASNSWDTDPYGSTSRRLGPPVLAHVLGFERNSYIGFWYAILFLAFVLAHRYLRRGGLGPIERLSVLSSSVFAYSLIGPGYNEVLVVLLGLHALQWRVGTTDKILVATMMIASHETATAFVGLALILHAEGEERREWLTIFGLLYAAHVLAFVLTWRLGLVGALVTAGRPSPDATDDAIGLLLDHPVQALFGVFVAYKVYWLVVAMAIARPSTRMLGLAVLPALILAVIGTDTSRLVEFGSLGFMIAMTATLPSLAPRTRTALALVNLAIPSLYLATNVEPLWGTGLYSLYLHAANAAGLGGGRLFVQ